MTHAPNDSAALPEADLRPIFIMGEHRSGTTILYKLLGLTECFNITTAFHVLYSDRLLALHSAGTTGDAQRELSDLFASWDISTRVIDNMPLEPGMPEEYGMHLFRKSGSPKLKKSNLKLFLDFCRTIQAVEYPERPILLKNPWDFANFGFIKSAIPNARFVFIHRHPIHILNSQLKAMQTNQQAGNPYVRLLIDAPGFVQTIHKSRPVQAFFRWATSSKNPWRLALRHLASSGEKARCEFIDGIAQLPADSYVSVKYEDLCQQPDEVMGRILAFVQASPTAGVDYQELIQPRPTRLLDEVQEWEPRLLKRFQRSMGYHHYA
ncbi:MAG: sulfotransferase [Planctomycetaceae bacterium]|nr:sulfotransferase [Planctomycetaceae bacterium]